MANFVWLWDGSGWVPALADSDGHLQVDALSVANPANLDVALSTIKANQQIQLARDVTWLSYTDWISNAWVILHTVTEGKKFYLTFYQHCMTNEAAVRGVSNLYVRNPAGGMWGIISRLITTTIEGLSDSNTFPFPLEIPALYDICISNSLATILTTGSILGWEE